MRARVALLAKDSALALDAARGAGLAMPLGAQAAAAFARALDAGLADADDAALFDLAAGRAAAAAALTGRRRPRPRPGRLGA
ncbi:MAG: NAD-binding protein [Rubrivivax sp.]|nr:NAD-binding protein [Rubrivivax sp.]